MVQQSLEAFPTEAHTIIAWSVSKALGILEHSIELIAGEEQVVQ
jgi:hypothetical protein